MTLTSDTAFKSPNESRTGISVEVAVTELLSLATTVVTILVLAIKSTATSFSSPPDSNSSIRSSS